jgi:carbamoyl-phosphate synthase large subunit
LQRKLIGGSTSWAKTIINKEIDIMCKQVADNIDLLGSMNIQLRLTDNGPKIFEINPRFSSTLLMRHLIGFQDLIWAINDSLDIENSYTSIPAGIELARTQDAVILKK